MNFQRMMLVAFTTASCLAAGPLHSAQVQAQPATKISMADFFTFLKSTDLIGSSQADIEKTLGVGSPLDTTPDTKAGEEKSTYLQYPVNDPSITAIEIQYVDGNVKRWRLAGHFAVEEPKPGDSSNSALKHSAWMTTNVARFDIPKQPALIAVASQKDAKQEPVLLVLFADKPSSHELLEAAKAARIGFFLKQADGLAREALLKAQNDDDTKVAAYYLKFRLPSRTSDWEIEQRHAAAYAKENSDPQGAAALYEKNIAEDPKFEFSYYTLAKLKELSGDYDGAAKVLEAVLKVNPEYQRAIFELAKVQLLQGTGAKAIETAKKALALNPDDQESKNTMELVQKLGAIVDQKSFSQFDKMPEKFFIVHQNQKRVWKKVTPFLWIETQPDGLKLSYWAMASSQEKGSGKNLAALRKGTILRRDDSYVDVFVPDPGQDPGIGYRYPYKTIWGPWADMQFEK